jgi:hypothetical protein
LHLRKALQGLAASGHPFRVSLSATPQAGSPSAAANASRSWFPEKGKYQERLVTMLAPDGALLRLGHGIGAESLSADETIARALRFAGTREPFDIPVFTKARISSDWLKKCDFVVLVVTSNMIHGSFRVDFIRSGDGHVESSINRWKGAPKYWLRCEDGIGLYPTALSQVETMSNGKWATQSKINAPGAWRYFRWSDPGFRTAATAWR